MSGVHRSAKKAICIVCDAVFICWSSKAMFCCDSCKEKGMAELDYNERHRRHEAAPYRVRYNTRGVLDFLGWERMKRKP